MRQLDFEPAFLRGFPHLEPTIPFSNWSAVFPSSQRVRHVSVTTCPLFSLSEPTIPFSDCSAVSHPKTRDFRFRSLPVTSFSVTSGSGDVISGHVTSP